jgi:lysophospholipid acyltransferase (LPLAT)-like uncharacterized protein
VKIRNRWLNWLVAASVVVLCRILFRTLRIRYCPETPNTNPYDADCAQGYIYCVWHDAIAYPMFAGRHHNTVALVSKNFDGSHLAFGLKMLGIGLVRGSSSKNGAGAVRELLHLPLNTHIVMTPDGPRGPRRTTKPGVVYIAARSGRAIVPTAFAAVRCWEIPGSWTTLSIPKPFTTVYALSAPPIIVAEDSTDDELAHLELRLQNEMNRLGAEATQLAAPQQSHTQTQPLARASRES